MLSNKNHLLSPTPHTPQKGYTQRNCSSSVHGSSLVPRPEMASLSPSLGPGNEASMEDTVSFPRLSNAWELHT